MITVSLEQDELSVEPGNTAKVQLTVANNDDAPGRYALEIEGLDLEWCAIPVPSFTLQPGEQTTERILVKPPRSSESRAGVYPFVVSVRSLESGEKVSKQGSVAVKSFNLLTIEISPKRGHVSPLGNTADFETMIANLGNTEQHVQLYASDPDDGFTYQFDTERVALPPGGQSEVNLAAQAASLPVIGATRFYGFTVTARSVENSHISASTQGQLERKGLISPSTLITLLVLVVLAVGGYMVWPRPAQVGSFAADSYNITQGQTVNIHWDTRNAKSVKLEYEGRVLEDGLKPVGSYQFKPDVSGKLSLVAQGGLGEVRSQDLQITVVPPPEAPLPKIIEFKVSPTEVRPGQAVTIHYKVEGAVRILISPLDQDLEPYLTDKQVVFPESGKYKLVAVNADKKVKEKPFTITVTPVGIKFSAEPKAVENPGDNVTLSWQLDGAVEASIDNGVGSISPTSGSTQVPIRGKITFTLTAKDKDGKSATRSITVSVAPQVTPVPAPDNTGNTGGA